MKRAGLCLIPLVMLLLLVSACGNRVSGGGQILPIRTETVSFDLETAKGIVAKGDSLIAGLQTQDTVSRADGERFLAEISKLYGEDSPWSGMFFSSNVEDVSCSEFTVQGNLFFPTMFHQGIVIVSAEIETEYFEEPYTDLDSQWLRIRMEYKGTDETLKNWNRTYVYRKWLEHPDWDWLFANFTGEVNRETSKNLLPMKEEIPWPPASFQ